MFCSFLSTVL